MNAFSIGDMGQSQDVQNPLIVSSGLVGYWSFNDGSGSVARDFSGNKNNGQLVGPCSSSWAPAKVGAGLTFFGSSNVTVPDRIDNRPGTGNWSVVFSVNAPSASVFCPFVSKAQTSSPFNQIAIGAGYVDGGGNGVAEKSIYIFTYEGSGLGFNSWYTIRNVINSNWHHVVIVRPSSTNPPSIYIDGQLAPLIMGGTLQYHNVNNTIPWSVYSPYTTSSIDEVRLYNRILNQSEITALCDSSGISNDAIEDWSRRVVAAGGTVPTTANKTIMNTFYDGLISNGLLSKMVMVNCFVSESLVTSITPLISYSTGDSWTNVGFVNSDLTVNGLKGNGSSKYLNSGMILGKWASSVASQYCGFTLYSTDSGDNNALTDIEFGFINTSNSNFNACAILNYGGNSTGEIGGFGLMSTTHPNTGSGYYSFNRNSQTSLVQFKASSTQAHSQVKSATGTANLFTITSPVYVFASYNAATGLPTNYSSRTLSFVAVHLPLTLDESAVLYDLVQTMRTSLGGGYV